MPSQPSLFADEPALPEGLRYRPDLLTRAEEAQLLARFEALPFKPFEFQGFLGKRQVVSFGWRYDFNQGGMQAAEAFPDWLVPARAKAADFAGLPPEALAQAIIAEYPLGAPIGWHRDRPQFDQVVGVSLLSACTLRFRRKRGEGWERAALTAEPRSVYLLSGPARSAWQHSIPPVTARRFSITFRTLR